MTGIEGTDASVAYRSKSMLFVRLSVDGEESILVLGITGDTKERVIVGQLKEINGEHVLFPSGVGWQGTDIEELSGAIKHFNSGV